VNPKFKKKVESIARKPVKTEDEMESLTPCPHCRFDIPETELNCPQCKNTIPFCIASGKHMILAEWSTCPSCKMCGIYTELKKVLEADPTCPMCEQPVPPMNVKISDNCEGDFKGLVALMKDPTDTKDEEKDDDLDSDDRELLA